MTARGFCVVAALSRYTNGLPWTCRCRMGKSLRTSSTLYMACLPDPGLLREQMAVVRQVPARTVTLRPNLVILSGAKNLAFHQDSRTLQRVPVFAQVAPLGILSIDERNLLTAQPSL